MTNKIECKECGNYFHNLGTHIRSKHNLNTAEYLARHPESPLTSEYFVETQRSRMIEQYKRTDRDYRTVAGKRPFDFVTNKKLKSLLQRDYSSAKLCLKNQLWKPCIILYGSIIEAILREITKAKDFNGAIEKAYEKNDITEKEYHKIHMIRDLRNFVHLHKEIEEGEEINDYWAKTFSDICESIIKRFQGKSIGS